MYECMNVCMYECMYVCMYECMYVCECICICACMCIYVCVRPSVRPFAGLQLPIFSDTHWPCLSRRRQMAIGVDLIISGCSRYRATDREVSPAARDDELNAISRESKLSPPQRIPDDSNQL